jgi:hypothetical protein
MATKKLTNKSNISSPLTGNTGHYWGTCGNIGGGTTTTTTTGNPYWINTPLIANPGQVITTGTNTLSWGDGISMNSDIVEYIDIFYQLMGIDMDYKRFSLMSKEEKRSFIRDIKLQKLIDDK